MEILRGIVLLCALLGASAGMTQEYFYKKYTASTFDSGNGIVQLPDLSYVVTGSSGGFDEYSSQTILMKVDKDGNQVWTKSYGGAGDDVGVRVMHVENEGFLIAGYSTSTDDGGFDFVLYKTNEQGDLQWEKKYGGSNWEILHDAQLMQDGGVVLVGQTEGPTTNGADIFMVRTDALGDTLWTKIISTPEADVAYAIDTLSATEILIGGKSGNNGVSTGMLAKFNIDGTEEWVSFYDSHGTSIIRDFYVYEQNIYAVGGIILAQNEKYKCVFKFDFNGVEVGYWAGSQMASSMFNTVVVRDANSLFMGYYADAEDLNPYPYGNDAFVLKFYTSMYYNDYSGTFSARGDDILNEIILTADGGIALVGTSSDSDRLGTDNYLGTDLMIVKIGPNDETIMVPDTGNDLVALSEETISNFSIYPNPTKNKVNIPEEIHGFSYDLVDFKGAVMKSGFLSEKIDISTFDAGVYFLRVKGENTVWNAKIIKE